MSSLTVIYEISLIFYPQKRKMLFDYIVFEKVHLSLCFDIFSNKNESRNMSKSNLFWISEHLYVKYQLIYFRCFSISKKVYSCILTLSNIVENCSYIILVCLSGNTLTCINMLIMTRDFYTFMRFIIVCILLKMKCEHL